MHQELIEALRQFTRENNLRFDYYFDDGLKMYCFVFQDQEQTWGYCRGFTEEQLDLFNGPTVYFAYGMIDTLKRRIPTLI